MGGCDVINQFRCHPSFFLEPPLVWCTAIQETVLVLVLLNQVIQITPLDLVSVHLRAYGNIVYYPEIWCLERHLYIMTKIAKDTVGFLIIWPFH